MQPTTNRWKVAVGIVLSGAIGYFVARSLYRQWGAIGAFDWRLRPGWLALSAALIWLDVVLLFELWRTLLRIVSGFSISFAKAYRVSMLANLGKYIPGKVWAVMGMAYLLRDEGVPVPAAMASSVLHQAFTIVPGAVFISLVLGAGVWGQLPAVAIAVGLCVCAVILYPPLFTRLLNWGLRLLRRPPLAFVLSFPAALGLFGAYVVAWVLYGAAFWCMTVGLGLPAGPFLPVTAAYGAAYLIGLLALFAPGGLGVREGILTLLLAPYLPAGLSPAVAVVSRLWMTLVELCGLIPVALGVGRPAPDRWRPPGDPG
ncbi:MAG: flippase-like domain-containing protein [Gemmatimonadales bacterium]|nr:flippase-like domain-containing protein [Gemmatimonadales bacterium]